MCEHCQEARMMLEELKEIKKTYEYEYDHSEVLTEAAKRLIQMNTVGDIISQLEHSYKLGLYK